jgi:transcriptional regulator with PAS, ATPase and Fis domain
MLLVRLADSRMSSIHAELLSGLGGWSVRDHDSRNGTLVNGRPQKVASLENGDVIECGHTLLLFRSGTDNDERDAPDVDGTSLASSFGLVTLLPNLARAAARLEKLGKSAVSIVIQAESGAGKEVMARGIHCSSERSGAFIAVNCGAIPANLVETELFGYRKGAFSGASEDRPGLLRAAHAGTLFLDEIADLPLAAQAALLRVLQEGEVLPVGGTRPVAVDVRVIAATQQSLDALVRDGRFRADLMARIAGHTIRIPALRERREDLGIVVAALIRRIAGENAERVRFSTGAARAIFRYPWPLNVRELEKCLQTALVIADGGQVRAETLPDVVRAAGTPAAHEANKPLGRPLKDEEKVRRDRMVKLLREHGGNVSATARAMSKGRSLVQRWIKMYGIDATEYE